MFKTKLFYSTLAITTLALASFSNPALAVKLPYGTKLAANQNYNVDIATNPPTLDPNMAYDVTSRQILDSLFEPLILQDPVSLKYVGAAAESWSISKDQKIYTFKLRKYAKWSDGKPVTAHDFVYAFQRIVDPKEASKVASYVVNFLNIKNSQDIVANKIPKEQLGVRAKDDFTLEITLEKPLLWFIQAISYSSLSPVRKDIVEKYGIQWTQPKNIVNNGPYKLDEYVPNEKVVISKRNDYWDQANIHITKANYNIIPNVTQHYNRFLAGTTDTVTIPRNFLEQAIAEKRKVKIAPRFISYALILNMENTKLADVRVRKALSIALDQKRLARVVIKLNSIPTSTWTPKGINGAQKITDAPWFNWTTNQRVQEARKLLAEAGYSKKNPLKLTFKYSTNEYTKSLFVGYQGMYKSVFCEAIEITLENSEFKVYLDNLIKNDFEVAAMGWSTLFDDAVNYLSHFKGGESYNFGKYNNPEYNKLFDLYQDSKNHNERQIAAQKLEYLLSQKDIALIPIYQPTNNYLEKENLKGNNPKAMVNYLRNFYFVK